MLKTQSFVCLPAESNASKASVGMRRQIATAHRISYTIQQLSFAIVTQPLCCLHGLYVDSRGLRDELKHFFMLLQQ